MREIQVVPSKKEVENVVALSHGSSVRFSAWCGYCLL